MTYTIYLYSDPKTLTPRYVGKAHNLPTMLRHAKGNSQNKKLNQMVRVAKQRGLEVQPEIICSEIKNNLSANAIERFWIAAIGRCGVSGPLFNGTDGGDGVTGRSGFKMAPRSEQWKERQSKSQSGPRPQSFKDTMSKAMMGVLKGRKQPLITCPHCGKEGGNTIMKRWHFDNCKENPNG